MVEQSSNRQPAGDCLEQHYAERVRPARKHEDVRRGEDTGKLGARLLAGEDGVGIALPQIGQRRPVADHQLGTGKVEIEEGRKVLLHGDPADIEEHRSLETEVLPVVRREALVVDAPVPQPHLPEPVGCQFVGK